MLLNMLLHMASIESRVELLLVCELLLLRGLLLLLWGLLVLLGREGGLLLHRKGGVLLKLWGGRRPVGPGVDGGGHSGPRHSCRVGELRPDAAYLLQDRIVAGLWGLCLSRLGWWPWLLNLRDGCSLWLSDGAGNGW
jgi:hypothetical protein